ncbi:unnamed protein product [Closterium sp. Naga37s-1]|nr:unnamed protein product [Closterium sp. Naga37s-1]
MADRVDSQWGEMICFDEASIEYVITGDGQRLVPAAVLPPLDPLPTPLLPHPLLPPLPPPSPPPPFTGFN